MAEEEYKLFNVPKEEMVEGIVGILHKYYSEIPRDKMEENIADIINIMDEETKKYNGWTDEARKNIEERIDSKYNKDKETD